MQNAAVGDYIRHDSGAKGKVTSLSPDGTIIDVYNLSTGKTATWVLSQCSPDIDDSPKYRAPAVPAVQVVKVTMGPIVGAVLTANLITGVVAFIVLLLTGIIH